MKHISLFCAAMALAFNSAAFAQSPTDSVDDNVSDLDEIIVTQRLSSTRKLRNSAFNTDLMTKAELTRAACCNLGESFTTNPSVDVNYTDGASGAKQIRLLGLPGTYVQMLTENIPNLRGAAAQFGLSYIPGPWIQSVQVSKGASSVKNGYESVTGQINIEMLKPQSSPSLEVNAYADHHARAEANVSGNLNLGHNWSGGLLLHGEHSFMTHDTNDDTFADSPRISQFSAMNRWAYFGDRYIFQAMLRYLGEKRQSGQIGHHASHISAPWTAEIKADRGEIMLKNAWITNPDNNGNIALITSATLHDQNSRYGLRRYDVTQTNAYASLMYEQDFGERHSISTGLSLNFDNFDQHYRLIADLDLPLTPLTERETTPGAYAQYTFNLDSRLILMAGFRYDHSSIYGHMWTPRLHGRWNISPAISLHLSAGKGYRSPFVLADNTSLLASSREIVIDYPVRQEEAWNLGGGASGSFQAGSCNIDWSAEYYYTDFRHQTLVDLDYSPDMALIRQLTGRSFSHSAQAELTVHLLEDLQFTAAYRYNRVMADYGRGLEEKPLTSASKALFTASYTPMMGLWQADLTLAVTGGGRMPAPRIGPDGPMWSERYKAFPTLNLQLTRNFRHWAVYVGGENLTGYRQKNPIIAATSPWSQDFDATMIYGPMHGPLVYVGFRYNITKL